MDWKERLRKLYPAILLYENGNGYMLNKVKGSGHKHIEEFIEEVIKEVSRQD